jgi:nucleoside-diphosphate-sugar epimerase
LTGSNGFVGSHIQQSKFFKDKSFRRFDRYKIDLNNIDAIFHFAGIAHDVEGSYSKDDYLTVNLELTKRIYNEFLISDVPLFIFLSSVKAVAEKCDEPLTEKTLSNPQSIYGESKLLAEEYIISKALTKGKRFVILRPSLVYGKNNKGNLRILSKLIRITRFWPLNSFKNARSFCYIDNLSFALNEILKNNSFRSGIYNMSDNSSISTNDLVASIARLNNISFLKINFPIKLVKTLAKIGTLFNLPFNNIILEKLTQNYIVDNDKIVKELGKPLPYSTEEGLCLTFNNLD